MSVRLFFVRHGQSESNLREDYYNDEGSELTGLGKYQAREVGRKLKTSDVKFRAIYCSPYKRAIDTCKIAMTEAGMPSAWVIVDERIGERKFNGIIGRVPKKGYNRKLYDYSSRQSILDGVESLEALEQRANDFIKDVVREYDDGDVLMFSHGVFGLAFRAVIEGRPATGNLYDWDLLKNGEIKVYVV